MIFKLDASPKGLFALLIALCIIIAAGSFTIVGMSMDKNWQPLMKECTQTEPPAIIAKSVAIKEPPKLENATHGNKEKIYAVSAIIGLKGLRKRGVPENIIAEKRGQCLAYINRFSKVAQEEQQKYGIPASIKLAQGLLESDANNTQLAIESNNHFGIKCAKKCRGCTCRNYSDDDQYDMFRVFDTAWESYRAHSEFLQKERYKHLKQYGIDYKKWAHGLKKAGYATDKNYARKLIGLIEGLELYKFD